MVVTLSYRRFLNTLPDHVIPLLPSQLQGIKIRQPWRWLIQLHYGEPRLHYEVSRPRNRQMLELGFHCEARDRQLNRFLLDGFRHHLFEIKDTLGEGVEAEMWDKGWTKIYELYPMAELSQEFQREVGRRLAKFITELHPIYTALRGEVASVYR